MSRGILKFYGPAIQFGQDFSPAGSQQGFGHLGSQPGRLSHGGGLGTEHVSDGQHRNLVGLMANHLGNVSATLWQQSEFLEQPGTRIPNNFIDNLVRIV